MIRWLKSVWAGLGKQQAGSAVAEAGARGEQAAADFLRARQGFAVLARN
ncbi:MAG: hypothetical protein QG602_545, partial [Verrucomicrobiota bacterium]|nr:hypothetical protein [Verrucomicrobiota bacterium]